MEFCLVNIHLNMHLEILRDWVEIERGLPLILVNKTPKDHNKYMRALICFIVLSAPTIDKASLPR